MANLLDMDPEEMPKDEDFVEWVAGNKVIKGSIPLSHRYGGYQFGYWVKTTVFENHSNTLIFKRWKRSVCFIM